MASTEPGTDTTRASKLMREAFTAIDTKDLDRLAAVWDDRTTDDFVALGTVVTGEVALRGFFAELFAAFPDLQMTVEAIHDVDEHTAVGQWRMVGDFTGGPFGGIEPTGRRVDVRGIDVMRFEGGKLRHNDVYYDGLSFARQIGLLPAADSRADHAMLAGFNALSRAKVAVRERRHRREHGT
jgi:ketosteroid isomerase-like protein